MTSGADDQAGDRSPSTSADAAGGRSGRRCTRGRAASQRRVGARLRAARRTRIDPLDVLDDEHQWLAGGQALHQSPEGARDLAADGAWVEPGDRARVRLLERQRQQLGERRQDLSGTLDGRGLDGRSEAVEGLVDRRAGRDLSNTTDESDRDLVGEVGAGGLAPDLDPSGDPPLCGSGSAPLRDEARLPDPGLPGHQDRASHAVLEPGCPLEEHRELSLASHEPPARRPRTPDAAAVADAEHLVRPHRLHPPSQRLGTQLPDIDSIGDEAVGRLGESAASSGRRATAPARRR